MAGSVGNTDVGKEMKLMIQSADDHYSVVSVYKKTASGFKRDWSVETMVTTPTKNIESTGLIAFEPGRQATIDFKILNLNPTPIQLKCESSINSCNILLVTFCSVDLQDQTKNQNKLIYSGEGIVKLVPYINTGFQLGMTLKPKINNLFLDLQYSFGQGRKQR